MFLNIVAVGRNKKFAAPSTKDFQDAMQAAIKNEKEKLRNRQKIPKTAAMINNKKSRRGTLSARYTDGDIDDA